MSDNGSGGWERIYPPVTSPDDPSIASGSYGTGLQVGRYPRPMTATGASTGYPAQPYPYYPPGHGSAATGSQPSGSWLAGYGPGVVPSGYGGQPTGTGYGSVRPPTGSYQYDTPPRINQVPGMTTQPQYSSNPLVPSPSSNLYTGPLRDGPAPSGQFHTAAGLTQELTNADKKGKNTHFVQDIIAKYRAYGIENKVLTDQALMRARARDRDNR